MPAANLTHLLYIVKMSMLAWFSPHLGVDLTMDLSLLTYYALLSVSFVMSLLVRRKTQYVPLFVALLATAVLTEFFAAIIHRVDDTPESYNLVYHLYVMIDYSITMLIFGHFIVSEKLKKVLRWSITLFLAICLFFVFKDTFYSHPGVSLNISGTVVILLSVYTLFQIRPHEHQNIFQQPIFWFCTGWIIYYAMTYIFNFLYDYLREVQGEEQTEQLQKYISRTANYLLYSAFIIGFSCLRWMRK